MNLNNIWGGLVTPHLNSIFGEHQTNEAKKKRIIQEINFMSMLTRYRLNNDDGMEYKWYLKGDERK